jgi:molybdopterin synthase catalytic subunit
VIRVQREDFDVGEEYETLRKSSHSPGAIVIFNGLVRELSITHTITAMELEHYPGMTEKSLQAIADQANERWQLDQITIIHRVGRLLPDEQILFVGVSSAHRREAFAACEFLIDFLKARAPFWKKEFTPEGSHWVEAKQSDQHAADRWRR